MSVVPTFVHDYTQTEQAPNSELRFKTLNPHSWVINPLFRSTPIRRFFFELGVRDLKPKSRNMIHRTNMNEWSIRAGLYKMAIFPIWPRNQSEFDVPLGKIQIRQFTQNRRVRGFDDFSLLHFTLARARALCGGNMTQSGAFSCDDRPQRWISRKLYSQHSSCYSLLAPPDPRDAPQLSNLSSLSGRDKFST